jgi:hypothetical protein
MQPEERMPGSLRDAAGTAVTGEGWQILVRAPESARQQRPLLLAVDDHGGFSTPPPCAGAEWFVSRRGRQPVWVPARAPRTALGNAAGTAHVGVELHLTEGFAATAWLEGRLDVVGCVDAAIAADAVVMATRGHWKYCFVPEIDPETGAFRAGWFPPGEYALRLVGRYGRFPPQDLGRHTMQAGRRTELGTIRSAPFGTLRYSFALTEGRVRQMRAWLVDAGDHDISLPAMSGTVNLPAGAYRLRAASMSFRSIHDMPVLIRAGEVTPLELELPPGHPRLLAFRIPPGFEPARARCRLVDAAGTVVLDEGFDLRIPGRGEIVVVLCAGRFELELRDGTRVAEGTLRIDAAADRHQPIEVDLRPRRR